jgi:hypothetical protein
MDIPYSSYFGRKTKAKKNKKTKTKYIKRKTGLKNKKKNF